MTVTVYPTDGYNSFISVDDATTFLDNGLRSQFWGAETEDNQGKALVSALQVLNSLDIEIDPTVTAELTALKYAQCEQAVHMIRHDFDELQAETLSLGGLLKVDVKKKPGERPPRISPHAIDLLKPYLSAPTVTRTR